MVDRANKTQIPTAAAPGGDGIPEAGPFGMQMQHIIVAIIDKPPKIPEVDRGFCKWPVMNSVADCPQRISKGALLLPGGKNMLLAGRHPNIRRAEQHCFCPRWF
jgi:hypothetical protein